jgi:hypothetical protein
MALSHVSLDHYVGDFTSHGTPDKKSCAWG